jgi:hypothetical protein
MDIIKLFEAIGDQMLIEFDRIQSEIEHSGGKGDVREARLKTFLETYLPHKYAIGNGEIVDSSGNTSRQCDLVIYDRTTSPILYSDEAFQVFLAESVYAVIEVKSVLSYKELSDAVQNIKSVKSLQRVNGKIGGILFAYKSNIKKDAMEKLSDKLIEANSTLSPEEYIDIICVLNKGVIGLCNEEGLTRLTEKLSERILMVMTDINVSILLYFYTNLLDLLEGQMIKMPDLRKYWHPSTGYIGMVSMRNPDGPE